MTELGLAYNLNTENKEVTFLLSQEKEYMLRYQLVALAKFHNHFGGIDGYMKEFARICMDIENAGKTLERLLNTEICVLTEDKHKTFIKEPTRPEIDPMVLAQPDFQFLPAGMKIKSI